VRFDTVAVRKYERIIDVENSDIDLGLAIGWRYEELEPVSLDSIQIAEATDPVQRARIFRTWGYTEEELQNARAIARTTARAKKWVSLKNRIRRKVKKGLWLDSFRKW